MNPEPTGEEHLYLVGHATLKEYLAFMTVEPLDARKADLKALADEWRAAHDHLRQLECWESVWADGPAVRPLPRALEPLLERVQADPIFRRSFSLVPADVGFVELDRLVVRHKLLNLAQVGRLKEQLGCAPDPGAIFRLCLPFDHPPTEFRMGRTPSGGFVFTSDSNNLRHLETVHLLPEQLRDYQPVGPMAAAVGLVVGFGSNYLNAIACENRLVLNNGHHRACALRELGVTHAPCVLQHVQCREELNVVAAGTILRNPDAYLKAPRPPLLKDYFEAKLGRRVRLVPACKQVKISFTIEESEVPA
jgi:hypothetical protein